MASCGRALFSFLLCLVLFSSLLCPVFSAADDIEVTPQTYWMAPGELWVGFFSPVSRDEPYTAEVSHFSGVHSGTGQIVRLTIPAYGEGFSSSALNAPSEHSAVSNLPVSFIFSFSCSGLSATDWYISADPSSQVRKLSDNSFLVENYHGESLALSSLSADVSSSVSVSMAYRPYDSELQADLDQIVSLLSQQVSIQTSGFSDVHYALARDGFQMVTILQQRQLNSGISSVSLDPRTSYYSVSFDGSSSYIQFMLSDVQPLSLDNGLSIWLSFLVPVDVDLTLSRCFLGFRNPIGSSADNFYSSLTDSYISSSISGVYGRMCLFRYDYTPDELSSIPFLPQDFTFAIYLSSGGVPFDFYCRIYVRELGQSIADVTSALNRIQQETDDRYTQSVDPGQAAATDQLQSEIDKSEAFESQIFEDVNTYTKQLDFGLSDWGEAASGISYISSIFMMIWNGSPKQPIILSLMFGLCMLLLGRGARLSGEIRKSSERSERRTKGS